MLDSLCLCVLERGEVFSTGLNIFFITGERASERLLLVVCGIINGGLLALIETMLMTEFTMLFFLLLFEDCGEVYYCQNREGTVTNVTL